MKRMIKNDKMVGKDNDIDTSEYNDDDTYTC